jgi:salicylate hydroxylase
MSISGAHRSVVVETKLTVKRVGGNNRHAIAYNIKGDKLINIVLTHPAHTEPEEWVGHDHVAQMQKEFEGWDRNLTTLLSMAETASKWPIRDVDVPDRWSSASRRTVLLGDAAHAMLQFMASGEQHKLKPP